jgi:hypothetical protein
MWIRETVAGIGLLVFFASTFVVTSILPAILPHL